MCGEGGHAWRRGACVAKGDVHGEGGGACMGYHEIRRYASYWNAFLLHLKRKLILITCTNIPPCPCIIQQLNVTRHKIH